MIPKHTTYIEPFVGGGSVFFSAPADPNIKDIINDKDKDIISIYMDAKKISDPIINIPVISKETFNRLKNQKSFSSTRERLKRNILLSHYSFRAGRQTYAPSKGSENYARTGAAGRDKDMTKYKERLKNTRILNQDYKSVIKKYDNPNAFIYLDPPYSTASANKDYNDNDIKIEDIINVLKGVKGKFILSYDNIPLAKKLAREAGFKVMNVKTQYNDGRGGDIMKTELIIRNY
tara:strand:- start:59 stop:757 length:699 start_codon:yes stop_codon:yes gene_type:complete